MKSFRIEDVDLKHLAMAQQILAAVVERLIEPEDLYPTQDDRSPDRQPDPSTKVREIDGVTPHRHYNHDDDCCEGMRW
jgi:hypothetical protein